MTNTHKTDPVDRAIQDELYKYVVLAEHIDGRKKLYEFEQWTDDDCMEVRAVIRDFHTDCTVYTKEVAEAAATMLTYCLTENRDVSLWKISAVEVSEIKERTTHLKIKEWGVPKKIELKFGEHEQKRYSVCIMDVISGRGTGYFNLINYDKETDDMNGGFFAYGDTKDIPAYPKYVADKIVKYIEQNADEYMVGVKYDRYVNYTECDSGAISTYERLLRNSDQIKKVWQNMEAPDEAKHISPLPDVDVEDVDDVNTTISFNRTGDVHFNISKLLEKAGYRMTGTFKNHDDIPVDIKG